MHYVGVLHKQVLLKSHIKKIAEESIWYWNGNTIPILPVILPLLVPASALESISTPNLQVSFQVYLQD